MNIIIEITSPMDETKLIHTIGISEYDGFEYTLNPITFVVESKKLYFYDVKDIKGAVHFLKSVPNIKFKIT